MQELIPLEVSSQIGTRIRTLRKASQLTQTQLADMCGFEPANLNRIERGKTNPTVRSLCLIANALGVSLSVIFEGI